MSKSPRLTKLDATIGANVRRIRLLRGMSQEKLGDALKLTFQQVQKYEKGTNRIGGSRLVDICRILKVDMNSLFEGCDLATASVAVAADPIIKMGTLPRGVELAAAFVNMAPPVQRAFADLCSQIAAR